jgi:hypothetical protein
LGPFHLQNDGRALALRAFTTVSQLIAGGILTKRCAKLVGADRHHTMAAATNIQQTTRSVVFMTQPIALLGAADSL